MPLPTSAALPRPTSQRRIRAARPKPPLIAAIPLVVGFCSAFALGELFDHDEAKQLTSPPHSEISDGPAADESGPPPPVAAAVGQAPRDGAAATPAPANEATHENTTAGASGFREPRGAREPREPRELDVERRLQRVLVDGKTPYAATVLLEIGTGRVIAVAEHSTRGASAGLATKAMAPAASIFKLVTTSALLQSGVSTSTPVCTHGGKTRMSPKLLVDNPKRDGACATFGEVVPKSLNVAIAKLALKHLDPDALRAEAARWGFGTSTTSTAHIPDDPFAFAEAAAGFGDVKISAMHGAMIAAAVVQDGVLIDGAGAASRAMPRAVADKLRAMMIDTVEDGTARRAFQQAPRLGVSAGGKTGSLTDYETGLDTSWFVGFAPADRPRVAVASVVVNTPIWHVKAPTVAKEALRSYFQSHPVEKKDGTRALVAHR